jgi:hypothetical protein
MLFAAPAAAWQPSRPTTAPAFEILLPADDRADRALLAEFGEQFRKQHTARFTIISSAPVERTAQLSTTAEETFEAVRRFAGRLRLPVRHPASKMTVIFFGQWEAYASYARTAGFHIDERAPTFFDERSNRCFLFDYDDSVLVRQKRREIAEARSRLEDVAPADPGDADRRERIRRSLRHIEQIEAHIVELKGIVELTFVRHEIAHQVLYNLGLQGNHHRGRRWLKEGLAMQFEGPEPVNRHRLADFRAVDMRKDPINLVELIADPKLMGPGAERLQQAYALAWALVHYLVHVHPEALAGYIQAESPRQGVPGAGRRSAIADFERAFGPLEAAFESRWRRYIAGLGSESGSPPGNQ